MSKFINDGNHSSVDKEFSLSANYPKGTVNNFLNECMSTTQGHCFSMLRRVVVSGRICAPKDWWQYTWTIHTMLNFWMTCWNNQLMGTPQLRKQVFSSIVCLLLSHHKKWLCYHNFFQPCTLQYACQCVGWQAAHTSLANTDGVHFKWTKLILL